MVDAQFVAAFGASALQNIAAVGGGHPGAEPVRFHFMPNFRLVRAFHLVSLVRENEIVKCERL